MSEPSSQQKRTQQRRDRRWLVRKLGRLEPRVDLRAARRRQRQRHLSQRCRPVPFVRRAELIEAGADQSGGLGGRRIAMRPMAQILVKKIEQDDLRA